MESNQEQMANQEAMPGAVEAVAAETAAPEVKSNKKWYFIHTYSGFERKVK